MSPDQFFLKYSTPLLALVILVSATALLDLYNPKNDLIKRLGEKYPGETVYFSTDQKPFYSPTALFGMLDKYSDEDRRAHIRFIYLDLIYPLIYSVTAAILLAFLLPVLLPARQAKFPYLSLLPIAAAVFDYLENLSMLWILRRYAGGYRPSGVAFFSSAMTTLKVLLFCAILLLFVASLGAFVVRALRTAGH
ncbi:MAG TPA: hypothetical protein VD835_05515 [Pyrinomonadaceae bacterium]|nr:hypothetical protein [Pyrinomonadaceae bacterium]